MILPRLLATPPCFVHVERPRVRGRCRQQRAQRRRAHREHHRAPLRCRRRRLAPVTESGARDCGTRPPRVRTATCQVRWSRRTHHNHACSHLVRQCEGSISSAADGGGLYHVGGCPRHPAAGEAAVPIQVGATGTARPYSGRARLAWWPDNVCGHGSSTDTVVGLYPVAALRQERAGRRRYSRAAPSASAAPRDC